MPEDILGKRGDNLEVCSFILPLWFSRCISSFRSSFSRYLISQSAQWHNYPFTQRTMTLDKSFVINSLWCSNLCLHRHEVNPPHPLGSYIIRMLCSLSLAKKNKRVPPQWPGSSCKLSSKQRRKYHISSHRLFYSVPCMGENSQRKMSGYFLNHLVTQI